MFSLFLVNMLNMFLDIVFKFLFYLVSHFTDFFNNGILYHVIPP